MSLFSINAIQGLVQQVFEPHIDHYLGN